MRLLCNELPAGEPQPAGLWVSRFAALSMAATGSARQPGSTWGRWGELKGTPMPNGLDGLEFDGRRAFELGMDLLDNPYPPTTPAWAAWRSEFTQAANQPSLTQKDGAS